ncbi:hypothetical protein FB639_002545 [Coemansia asiatica]|nr:hypothetical protein FB639_002545 [Coemansia asiatica]
MTKLVLFIVDAFTTKVFGGNAAGVVMIPYDHSLEESAMQKIASELNKPMTAFVQPASSDNGCTRFTILWFNPVSKGAFCGHATLAASHVLFNEIKVASRAIELESPVGLLEISNTDRGIGIRFPISSVERIAEPGESHIKLLHLFMNHNNTKQQIASGDIEFYYSQAINDILVFVNAMTKQQMDMLEFELSKEIADAAKSLGIRAVVVLAESDDKRFDSLARVFGVQGTIGEDQVTGSAHTAIASVFLQKFGKRILRARQCSQRGGDLLVEVEQGNSCVVITGSAVTIVSGIMCVDQEDQ